MPALESYEGGEGENSGQQATNVKLEPGQRLRHVSLTDCRTGKSAHGVYMILFMTDVTNNEPLSMILGIGNPTDPSDKGSVFGRKAADTFTYVGNDAYRHVKPELHGKPIWIGMVEKKSKNNKNYKDMEWGFEGDPAVPSSQPSGQPPVQTGNAQVDEPKSTDLKFADTLESCREQGMDKFGAMQYLIKNIGIASADAARFVDEYYAAVEAQ